MSEFDDFVRETMKANQQKRTEKQKAEQDRREVELTRIEQANDELTKLLRPIVNEADAALRPQNGKVELKSDLGRLDGNQLVYPSATITISRLDQGSANSVPDDDCFAQMELSRQEWKWKAVPPALPRPVEIIPRGEKFGPAVRVELKRLIAAFLR
ncbi:hypothetical protein [Ancylobacter vacuolatus]|uniref:Uncharacterized protein n=1 Tax=Ancylobacter vacuolatus TaxID=223389 RepID=A0ABU0DHH4_9HYPH|nr:hypothetical protein [Ancylobacter vacuolatus]MDQ0347873.1 hypothetical protein [Ancylobacter vacuolatus]